MARVLDHDSAFDDMAHEAMATLASYFEAKNKRKKLTAEDHAAARIAQGVVSSWTRHRATQSAMDALRFMVVRELHADETGTLRTLLRQAMPSLPAAVLARRAS